MKAWKEITYYAGFDWAHDHHDVVIVDRRGQIVADFEIQHTAAGWQRWNQQVAALGAGAVAVCVETSQGLIIEQLLESGVNVYPIAPVSSKAYRERKAPVAPRPIGSMPGVWPMRCASMARVGKCSPRKIRSSPSCGCYAATKSR